MPSTTQDSPAKGESFAAIFEATAEADAFAKEGEIISGAVVQVDRDFVIVDIGGKSEGVISIREFGDADDEGRKAAYLMKLRLRHG